MLNFMPGWFLGVFGYGFLFLNFFLVFIFFLPIALLKKYNKNTFLKKKCTVVLVYLGSIWINLNQCILKVVSNASFDFKDSTKLLTLPKNSWYLIISNHRSWVDVIVLQMLFNRRIPMLKFFIKQELRKFPLMGFVWDSLDCPFLKRHTKEHLKNNPADIGQDFLSVKESCEKFKLSPVAIVDYLEGSRFTQAKHEKQQSPYKHLLLPRAGGLSCVLSEMDGFLYGIIDVTIFYNPEQVSFWDLFSGKVKKVTVKADFIEIPDEIKRGNYGHDHEYRQKFQTWVNSIWQQKDDILDEFLKEKNNF